MARLKYDSNLVNSAIDELSEGNRQLINTEDDMRSALTIIANARGVNYVHTDTLFNTIGYPSACQEMIEETIADIRKRVTELEEYNKEYENASFLEKLGSTAGLFLTKICEGIASSGEQIVDGFASVIGLGAGLLSEDAQKSIENFIKKDYIGDFFNNLYDTSLKSMVTKSLAAEDGLACNLFKGIGTGIGYAAALAATGGITGGPTTGTALGAKAGVMFLTSSIPAAAAISGVAGLGNGMQIKLQEGVEYGDAMKYGVKIGLLQAGTTVVFSYAFKALSKGFNLIKNKFKGTPKSTDLVVTNNSASATNGGTSSAARNATGSATRNAAENAAGSPISTASPKSGITFKSQYKGYSSLDDVWDDVVAGKLNKNQVRDILKNTIGMEDGDLGHSFYSDALNVIAGKNGGSSAATPIWKDMAAKMSGTTFDDTISAATSNITNTGGSANPITNMVDDTFNGSNASTAQDIIETTAKSGNSANPITNMVDDTLNGSNASTAQELVGNSSQKNLSTIKREMENSAQTLIKKQNNLNLAQQNLDDAIANGADDSVVSSLQKKVTNAQNQVNSQLDKLRVKQQAYITETSSGQYNAIGTEKMKLINGEFVDDINSVAGDVTTLRVTSQGNNGTLEVRPNWTNASAIKEGQIDIKEFAKLLDKKYGPVPTPDPLPVPVPTPDPLPVPVPTPDPLPVPVPTPDPLPVPVPTPDPLPVPVPTPSPTPTLRDTIIFGVIDPEPAPIIPDVNINPKPVDPVIVPEQVISQNIETPIPPTPMISTNTSTSTPTITPSVPLNSSPQISPDSTPIIPNTTPSTPIIPNTTPSTPSVSPNPKPPFDLEYAPIPNTGIGGEKSRITVAPIIAGAVAGIASAIGDNVIKSKNRKEEDIEELEYESEE